MVGPKRGLALDAGWADLLSVTAFGANHFSDGESVQGMVFCFVVTESASVQLLAAGALQKNKVGKAGQFLRSTGLKKEKYVLIEM